MGVTHSVSSTADIMNALNVVLLLIGATVVVQSSTDVQVSAHDPKSGLPYSYSITTLDSPSQPLLNAVTDLSGLLPQDKDLEIDQLDQLMSLYGYQVPSGLPYGYPGLRFAGLPGGYGFAGYPGFGYGGYGYNDHPYGLNPIHAYGFAGLPGYPIQGLPGRLALAKQEE